MEGESPELFGFSPFETSSHTAALLANELARAYGNFHATFNAERILRNYPSVDIIVRGEGEQAIIDLVEYKNGIKRLGEILGITFRKGDEIVSTPDRLLIKDIVSIPIPDRSLLEEEYHGNIAGARIAMKKFTSVISSRGCVYVCRFCSCSEFSRAQSEITTKFVSL
jgi:anaerobic magnesium-protoporphyrin IX monomethyl ester cyclase